MVNQENEALVQNFLEGLKDFNLDFFFPYDKLLYEDIKDKLENIKPEEKENLLRLFNFPIKSSSEMLEEKETQFQKNEISEDIAVSDIGEIGVGMSEGEDIGEIGVDMSEGEDIGEIGVGEEVLDSTRSIDFSSDFDSNFETPSLSENIEQIDVTLGEDELRDMQKQSLLEEGIGSELTDEELAKLRESILSYSDSLRKVIIDSIVNEKLSRTDQKLLVNMLIEGVEEPTLLDFFEEKLGFRPKIAVDRTKEGIPIIYVGDISPEALERKRKRAKLFLILMGSFFLGAILFFSGIRFYNYYQTTNLYELGLEELKNAEKAEINDKEIYIQKAEEYFNQALINEGEYNIQYLHKYASSFIRLGKYEKAFEKLFGKIEPEYAWNSPTLRVPLIQKASNWKSLQEIRNQHYTEFFSKDQIRRKLLVPGAFTLLKLKYEKYEKENLIYLAKFHSLNIPHFLNSEEGKKYKNDNLAIDYYRIILTLLDKTNDPEALSGIGKIYYNQKKYTLASQEYQKIIDFYPDHILGHDGILNTYIEIWRENQDPRYVIAKHRYLQSLGLEEKLPIYTLSKLAGFYIDIQPEELRIKYNVDPVNTLNQLDIEANIQRLLDLVFHKKEKRDDEVITGSQYGEGFYQRGRFYYKRKQFQIGAKQFQNAFYYDPKHFPSLYYLGLYYLYNLRDYAKSQEYFLTALETFQKYKDYYGIRPEDETMISFNQGLIYYELVSTIFEKYKNALVPPVVSLNEPSEQFQNLVKEINSTEEYNQLAIKELTDQKKLFESYFRQGVIEYINGNFQSALHNWLKIDDGKILESPNFYVALGNASFYSKQNKQALNFFLLAKDLLISKQKLTDLEKKLLYNVYNNLGTIYESLAQENQKRFPKYKIEELQQQGLEYYYKSVEYAIQNQILPNRARLNIDLFLRRDVSQLLLEDEILFHL